MAASSKRHWIAAGLCASALALAAPVLAESGSGGGGGGGDRATEAADRAERDAARAAERAAQDQARAGEERARIIENNAADPARLERELADLEADRARDALRAQEEAAKIAEDLAEDLAKEAEDAADDAADRAEDEAEAERFGSGSSAAMRDLAADESPDFDESGYPVRRGEIVGLDLTRTGLAALQAQGFTLLAQSELPALGSTVYRLSGPDGQDAGATLAAAQAAEPAGLFDYTHYYGAQYETAGASEAGAAATLPRRQGSLTLGMIDTGVVGHPALRGVNIELRDFGSGAAAVPTAHGTAIASILASEGSSHIYAANVFRGRADAPFTSADAIIDALNWMVANRVPVVNMSLSGPRNIILDRLIAQVVGRGTLIVAAAGNGGPSASPAYPAALSSVIAVTAVDANDRVYRYANQGRYITVAALGVDQPAADAAGGISRFDGTSYATPHIAAWIARCLGGSNAGRCVRSLRREARDLGEPGFDPVYGHGLIE